MYIFKTFAITTLLWSATLGSYAQNSLTTPPPSISVTGTAIKEITPDEIYISITLRERSSGKDQASVEQQEEQLKGLVKDLGISLSNLTLQQEAAYYTVKYFSRNDVLANKQYQLKVADAAMVGRVFSGLAALKIEYASISHTSHSQIVALRKEVKIMAIKAAKEKADYMLVAIGQKTGKALKIVENEGMSIPYTLGTPGSAANFIRREERVNGDDDALGFGKITLKASISAEFAIEG